MMIHFKLGFRNSWRQRGRNTFLILSVLVGTAAMISLSGYINRWRLTFTYDSIYLKNKGMIAIYPYDGLRFGRYDGKRYALSETQQAAVLDSLHKDPTFESAGRYLYGSGLASNGCLSYPFELTAYDPKLDHELRAKPIVKRWASALARFQSGQGFGEFPDKAVVGVSAGLARSLGNVTTLDQAKGPVKIDDLNAYCEGADSKERIAADPNLQIVAVRTDRQLAVADADMAHIFSTGLALTDDAKLTAPLILSQDLFGSGRVSYMTAYYQDFSDLQRKAHALEEDLARKGLKLEVFLWDDERWNPTYVGTMNFLYTIGLFFFGLILAVVVLSVINLTTMNLLERSREIGTLKAIGFKERAISLIFLSESLILASGGVLLGYLLSTAANNTLNASNIEVVPPGAAFAVPVQIVPDERISIAILVAMFAVVTLSAFVTSRSLAKKSALELLS